MTGRDGSKTSTKGDFYTGGKEGGLVHRGEGRRLVHMGGREGGLVHRGGREGRDCTQGRRGGGLVHWGRREGTRGL